MWEEGRGQEHPSMGRKKGVRGGIISCPHLGRWVWLFKQEETKAPE